MSSTDEIQTYINYLLLPHVEKDSICNVFQYIENFNTEDIDPVRAQLAELFCICSSKLTKELASDVDVSNRVSLAFRNIKRIISSQNIESYLHDEKKSYLIAVYFLSLIQDVLSNSKNPTEQMRFLFKILCEKLDMMHWLFQIEKDGKKLFPIGKLLNYVIDSKDFFVGNLDDITFYTFLLAIEVFDSSQFSDEKKKVDGMLEAYHLDCLKLLKKTNVLKVGGDIGWRENFKKNGALTILVPNENSFDVYIRHTERSYFDHDGASVQLHSEKNSRNDTVAFFCYLSYNGKLEYSNYNELFEKKDLSIWRQVCRLIFSEKQLNVFLDNSFVKVDGKWLVANPFVVNDKVVISERGNENHSNSDVRRVMRNFLSPYLAYRIKGLGFDYVMLGSVFSLLCIDSKPIDEIFDLLDRPFVASLQDKVIMTWAKNVNDYETSITQLKTEYFASVEYAKKRDSIDLKKINDILWLPYKFPCGVVDSYLQKQLANENANSVVLIKVVQTFDGFDYLAENGDVVKKEDIFFDDDCEKIVGEFYLMSKTASKYVYKSDVDKICKLKKSIEQDNILLHNAKDFAGVDELEIDSVVDTYMSLHKDALIEVCNCKEFKSIAYLRLFHHLLYCKLFQKDKWLNFYRLLRLHQPIKFDSFKDEMSQIQDSNTLVVPKERMNTGNTLVMIYNKYGQSYSVRSRSIFDREVEMKSDKYYLENGCMINKVVILFDTLQSGTSTKNVLRMYFDGELHEKKNVSYIFEGNPVYLEEIISRNNASVELVALYGTDEGKKCVEEFISQSTNVLNKAKEIKIIHRITVKADRSFVELAKDVYPHINDNLFEKPFYPIIREFNQPKKNVFPESLLKPENIASIFVKKEEF